MTRRNAPTHELDYRDVRALGEARVAAQHLLDAGVRHSHGLAPNERLVPAARRDLRLIVAAVERIMEREGLRQPKAGRL